MAIENGKLLNVRIKNKYDSYGNWANSGLVLEAGEIAIAHTTVDVTADGVTVKHPALLMKVGDGASTFAQLPWLSAKAADVLSVCKNEAELTTFVSNVIANAGIATDAAMKALTGRVTTAEGAIDVLEDLVGSEAVSKQIADAIAALNLATTYEKVGVAKGLVDALADGAVKDNADAIAAIKDGTTLDSFADVETALAGKQAAGDYATKAEAQAMADGKDAAIAAAKKAGDDAQADVDALAGKVGTVPEGKTVVGMIADAQTAATYDDTEVRGLITAAQNAADAAQGDVDTLTQTHATDKKALEDAIALKADQTALDAVSAVANAAVKQTDYDAKVQALEAADTRIEGLVTAEAAKAREEEGKLDARLVEVETFFKTAEGETLDTALDTLVEIQKYLDGEGEVADQMLLDIGANKSAIEKLNGTVTEEGSVAKSINDAIVGLNLANTYEPKGAEDRAKTYADGLDQAMDLRVDAVEAKLKDIEANADVNVIETVKVNGVALTPDASKAVDVTVPTGALASKDKVAKADLEEALANELDAKATEADLTLAEGRIKALEDANKEGGAVATAIKEAKDAADAAQADADALELLVGNEKVSDQIDAKITALNLANTYEAKGTAATEAGKVQTALNTYKTDNDAAVAAVKATADTAVQTVTAAADSGLKATRTGNDVVIAIDEALTFILDCGTSAE